MVEYDDLMNSPQETMNKIYEFLEVDTYLHNFEHIDNTHRETEYQWKLKDMHSVRRKLSKKSKRPEDVLSQEVLNKYKNLEYWKYSNHRYF